MRPRAAALILENRKVVLIQRLKDSQNYWVLPGGTMESKETPEETCKREIQEEVGLDIEIVKLITKVRNLGRDEYYFLAKRISGELRLGEPELSRSTLNNRYIPNWVNIERLHTLNLVPDFLKTIMAEPVAGGDAAR